MHTKWVFKHFRPKSNRRIYIFAVLWVIGLLLGVLLYSLSDCDVVGIFYYAVNSAPSPASLFLICALPTLLLAVAFALSLFPIAWLIVFLVAVFQGFSGSLIYAAVGSATWLLRSILLFTASCSSVLMWWFLLQCMKRSRLHKNIRFVIIFSCVTSAVDLFFLSPLINDLAKYF